MIEEIAERLKLEIELVDREIKNNKEEYKINPQEKRELYDYLLDLQLKHRRQTGQFYYISNNRKV